MGKKIKKWGLGKNIKLYGTLYIPARGTETEKLDFLHKNKNFENFQVLQGSMDVYTKQFDYTFSALYSPKLV